MKRVLLLMLSVVLGYSMTQAQNFTDVTGNLPQVQMSMVAWIDFDNDSDLDLYISGDLPTSDIGGGLFRNDNGTFVEVTNSGLPLLDTGQAVSADFNNDGNMDLAIMGYDGNGGSTDIYYNNGDGTFSAANAGFPPTYMGDISAVDINNDGKMDVAFTGKETVGWSDITKIYIQEAGNVFNELPGTSFPGMNFGKMQFGDYDNDGYPDFILNGWGPTNVYTKIWHNDNGTAFTETSIPFFQSWLGDLQWGDVDGDGDLDLMVSGVGGSTGDERHTTLNINNGDGTFTESTLVTFEGLSHSAIELFDFDNNGTTDIFLTGANDTPGVGSYYSRFYSGRGNGIFIENTSFFASAENYGDAKAADFDNDGDIDLIITGSGSTNAPETKLWRNETISLSVSNINTIDFSIYPNPSNGQINIQTKISGNHHLIVTDLTGKTVYQTHFEGIENKLNLSFLHKGIYMIKLDNSIKKLMLY